MSQYPNISKAAISILTFGAGAVVIYKFSAWLFSGIENEKSENNVMASKLSEQVRELKLYQELHGTGHDRDLQQIIELQHKYLKIQKQDILNKQKEQERVDEELTHLKESIELLKMHQSDQLHKNHLQHSNKFEQMKTELKKNNQQMIPYTVTALLV